MSELSLTEALHSHERRSECHVFKGTVIPDKNRPGWLLIVVDKDTYYSVDQEAVVETESVTGRVWVKQEAAVWRSARISQVDAIYLDDFIFERRHPAPQMRVLPGAPTEGTAGDQAKLMSGQTIEGAAKLFAKDCAGGDNAVYANNCAHFLSNAFIVAGFVELFGPEDCISLGGRCETSARRPIRARDMWCWFKSKATESGSRVVRGTGLWAVFQLDDYSGGHVAIIDSNSWKYYGTGWYDDWGQYSYKW
jgi:hypothetical protein